MILVKTTDLGSKKDGLTESYLRVRFQNLKFHKEIDILVVLGLGYGPGRFSPADIHLTPGVSLPCTVPSTEDTDK